jgi:hypothetical protein
VTHMRRKKRRERREEKREKGKVEMNKNENKK